jgi:3',5'-cyclic AMP phosphodiesterase CpdA
MDFVGSREMTSITPSTKPSADADSERAIDTRVDADGREALLLDPRCGDVEDDKSSTEQKSLFAIAGNLLVEISLPKLLFAWTVSIVVPAILLGLAPLIATAWLTKVSGSIATLTELSTVIFLIAVVILGLVGWRPLLRIAEVNFWSLNALAVQPGYALCREALRHLAEQSFGRHANSAERARLRAMASAGAGLILCACAAVIVLLVWPATRWTGALADILSAHRLILPTLANAVVLVLGYLAIASLIWGFADAIMDQPLDLAAFDAAPPSGRIWRIAHLSDIHMVGERYGFRIESGRNGPRGNDRLDEVMARIEAIHAETPLDLILVSGDMTDAGRSTEWAEFLDMLALHPALAERTLILPGNHDVNIVDRANPARLDLPFSPGKRLRQMRALAAIAAAQGDRVRVIEPRSKMLARTLAEALADHRRRIAAFADTGAFRLSLGLGRLFDDQFPMVMPPDSADGLGVVILNSNAETHFSFTNALGMVSADQARRLAAVLGEYPKARWIIALHHHLMEYPMPVAKFSERIGTALINGSWFIRKLKPFAGRAIVMHGHRHIDWIGECGGVKIISAPSPVMGAKDDEPTHFHIHTLAVGEDGRLRLLAPERVDIHGAVDGSAAR